ncbi:MAG: hypothetical protein HY648_11200 [Acidobacteria bacterium]|nr:hypothetical protein [Acidobacteriota bacterium]
MKVPRALPSLFAASLLLIRASSDASAEPQTNSADITRLILGSASGEPGETAVVPIYFTPAEGVKAGRLKITVDFVSRNLKYSRIESSAIAQDAGVDISAEAKEGKNAEGLETTTLTITASLPKPESSEKGIPFGLLGYMMLNVGAEARPAEINLRASAEARDPKSNQLLGNFEASGAVVDIIERGSQQPSLACFVFSH